MKRILLSLIALTLALTLTAAALAEPDLSPIRENDSLFTLDIDSENDVAFIQSTMTAAERSFTHDSESVKLYSDTMFDIIVISQSRDDGYPVMRLWITYSADDGFLNIDSVTFIVGGREFSFSGIASSDWCQHDERGYLEQVLIKFGTDNISFLAALNDLIEAAPGEGIGDKAANASCTMILHGSRDVYVELGKNFFLDYETIFLGMSSIGGFDYLEKAVATEMTEN